MPDVDDQPSLFDDDSAIGGDGNGGNGEHEVAR